MPCQFLVFLFHWLGTSYTLYFHTYYSVGWHSSIFCEFLKASRVFSWHCASSHSGFPGRWLLGFQCFLSTRLLVYDAKEHLTCFPTGKFPSLHIWAKSAEGRCWSESCTSVPHLGKTHMYPRGSYCHILHSIKLCESHFIWSCHGYSLDPAGPRSKEESSMCTRRGSQCEIFNGWLCDQIANQNRSKLLIWQ